MGKLSSVKKEQVKNTLKRWVKRFFSRKVKRVIRGVLGLIVLCIFAAIFYNQYCQDDVKQIAGMRGYRGSFAFSLMTAIGTTGDSTFLAAKNGGYTRAGITVHRALVLVAVAWMVA